MGNYILHKGAVIQCMHAGQAQPMVTNPRVKVSGQEIMMQANGCTIAGCTLPPPTAGNGPCATAQWVSAATRVKAGGVPVLTKDSRAVCAPTLTGVNIINTQVRVKAT
jgi:hypothetical protein